MRWASAFRSQSQRHVPRRFLIKQQAYLSTREGKIGWMRVLCSGYRPDTRD